MLEPENPFIGKNIIWLDETDSTNDYALRKCHIENYQAGTIIITRNQTAGKGQMGASWISEPHKNLTFSVVLKPQFLSYDTIFELNKAVSLATLATLENYLDVDELKIKWPNDILFKKKKIAGILIHNQWLGSKLETSIVGIGININQTQFNNISSNFPPTSVLLESNKEFDIEVILKVFCSKLSFFYEHLVQSSSSYITGFYLRDLLNYQVWSEYLYKDKKIKGLIDGVDSQGFLILRLEDNTLEKVNLKEIQYLNS